jgi:hypothetical protein
MRRAFLILLVSGLLTAGAVPVTAHDAPNRCGRKQGDGAGWWQNRGHYVGCEKARKLAQRWEDKCVWNDNCPGEPDKIHSIDPGWKCTHKDAGYESVRVRCTANQGPAVVHFLWGS